MREIDYNKRSAYETADSERASNLRTALDGLGVDYCYGRFELDDGDPIYQFEFDAPAVAEAIAVQKLKFEN